jgi:hypothetical protein
VRGVLSGAQLPLYFPGNYGREPLFLYLQSAFVTLLGYTPYALRVTAPSSASSPSLRFTG